ncbi:MAG: glycosyltransferase [Dechloromonas sp.]|nr:glycosyltransferase [Dechloromonas sp.]
MAERLASYPAFRRKKIVLMPPLIGQVASRLKEESNARASRSASERLRLLYITGASQHKNIWRLGEMLQAVRSLSNADVEVVVTVSQQEYLRCCKTAGIRSHLDECGDRIVFLGATHGEELLREIKGADIIMNISDLESISNNFIEAEACRKPMLIAERDFALSSVRTSYVTCEPHDPVSFVKAIEAYLAGNVEAPSCSGELAIPAIVRANNIKEIFQGVGSNNPSAHWK